ncbi:CCHC-type domain-containing protein [Trichonephila inaurata madagascariensis]|uniref:CCHC-type domain-containing protein n=1 Tax=Trichonephila inaurata madagascariensis TaxID=2747483 RepID=A0A8X7BPK1_9ARAC|nr:CCHC-type domain-containing protein [Trichonephila inaurata madagascariensis]
MAYLGKARKEDLRLLAEELNLNVGDNMKIADLSKLITTHPDYDEEFSKNLLTIIVEDRKWFENERLKELTSTPEAKVSIYELTKVVPKFEMKDGDIVLFLTLFERQAKRVSIEKRHWVSALLALMPSEINQLMARESEEKFDDYD